MNTLEPHFKNFETLQIFKKLEDSNQQPKLGIFRNHKLVVYSQKNNTAWEKVKNIFKSIANHLSMMFGRLVIDKSKVDAFKQRVTTYQELLDGTKIKNEVDAAVKRLEKKFNQPQAAQKTVDVSKDILDIKSSLDTLKSRQDKTAIPEMNTIQTTLLDLVNKVEKLPSDQQSQTVTALADLKAAINLLKAEQGTISSDLLTNLLQNISDLKTKLDSIPILPQNSEGPVSTVANTDHQLNDKVDALFTKIVQVEQMISSKLNSNTTTQSEIISTSGTANELIESKLKELVGKSDIDNLSKALHLTLRQELTQMHDLYTKGEFKIANVEDRLSKVDTAVNELISMFTSYEYNFGRMSQGQSALIQENQDQIKESINSRFKAIESTLLDSNQHNHSIQSTVLMIQNDLKELKTHLETEFLTFSEKLEIYKLSVPESFQDKSSVTEDSDTSNDSKESNDSTEKENLPTHIKRMYSMLVTINLKIASLEAKLNNPPPPPPPSKKPSSEETQGESKTISRSSVKRSSSVGSNIAPVDFVSELKAKSKPSDGIPDFISPSKNIKSNKEAQQKIDDEKRKEAFRTKSSGNKSASGSFLTSVNNDVSTPTK